jgi:hypothetical protein
VDALVFEFMGLAMLGLCVIVLAVPSEGQPPAAFALTDPAIAHWPRRSSRRLSRKYVIAVDRRR